jgi:hypothetical protein
MLPALRARLQFLTLLYLCQTNGIVGRVTRNDKHGMYDEGDYPFRFLLEEDDNCKVIQECELCDAIARADVPECAKTGRIERLICLTGEDGMRLYIQFA